MLAYSTIHTLLVIHKSQIFKLLPDPFKLKNLDLDSTRKVDFQKSSAEQFRQKATIYFQK